MWAIGSSPELAWVREAHPWVVGLPLGVSMTALVVPEQLEPVPNSTGWLTVAAELGWVELFCWVSSWG